MSVFAASNPAATVPKAKEKEVPQWSPYEDNGGTAVAIAGKDYVLVAADTRLSVGFSILARDDESKFMKMSDKTILVSCGMQADRRALHKYLDAHLIQYRHAHHKQLSSEALSQMLSNTLYYRRFGLIYYTFNMLCGLDENGAGAVYSYDAIGSYQRLKYGCQGSGQQLMLPVLDSVVGKKNQENPSTEELSQAEALDLVKDVFASATERDIYTGDSVILYMITADGVEQHVQELRHD